MRWIPFMSQTGTEVREISNLLHFLPSLLVTNDYDRISEETQEWIFKMKIPVLSLPSKPTLDHYLLINPKKDDLITLHGYLRILPKAFVENQSYTIYNGHPGLITDYPELKGKDPQIRAWEGRYDIIGSVIHEVTPEVDEGKVVMEMKCNIKPHSKINDYFEVLRNCSLTCWMNFFQRYLERF